MNTLYLLDNEGITFNSEAQRAYYTCNKNWAAARLLTIFFARDYANELAQQILNTATKYQFNDFILHTSKMLMISSSMNSDIKEFEKYAAIADTAKKVLDAEMTAEKYIFRVYLKSSKGVSESHDVLEETENMMRELKSLKKNADSFNFRLNYYRLALAHNQLKGEFTKVIQICNEVETYMKRFPQLYQPVRSGEFNISAMVAFTMLRDFKRGNVFAKRCISQLIDGSNNWFTFMEYYFLLSMYTGNYSRGSEIYKQVTAHPRLKSLPERQQEKWAIFEAYLQYISLSEASAEKKTAYDLQRKFNVFRFMNETVIYSKDKMGYNVAILVAQILCSLEVGNFDFIFNKSEALKSYINRYLKSNDTIRSKTFLNMILRFEKNNFDPGKTEHATQELFKTLLKTKVRHEGGTSEVEVIPYDVLWTKIMKSLHRAKLRG